MSAPGFAYVLDGPAAGWTGMLRRAPMYLRIVIKAPGTVALTDALDQPEDCPDPDELVYVYRRRPGTLSRVHIRPGGCYTGADYEHMPEVDGDELRDTETWRSWAQRQPAVP